MLRTLFIIGCLAYSTVYASNEAQTESIQLARQGVDALSRLQFDQSAATFTQLQKQAPDFVFGHFLSASVDWIRAEAEQNRSKEKRAWAQTADKLQNVIELAEEQLQRQPGHPQWQLTLGTAQFFLARVYAEQKHYIDTYFMARKSRDTLRQLIAKQPDLYDAYFALGTYEYIAGSVPRGVRWLAKLFDLDGNRQTGIAYLAKATAQAPVLAPEAARMLLAAAALQPELIKQPCQYLSLSRESLALYPQNPHFSGAYQMLHLNCGYPQRALDENQRGRNSYLKHFPKMKHILNITELFAHRSMGDLQRVKNMKPLFKKKNTAYWHLAMAQIYDLSDKRTLARKHYHIIAYSGYEDEPDVLANSSNEDWILDKVDLHLKEPFTRPAPYKPDPVSDLKLQR
ncbi:MAG: hypothetical protein HUJ30_06415 [Gammaproteobacteria bacterium]|nr:hypothetical protein [Gammaproteobacteria bacterium]